MSITVDTLKAWGGAQIKPEARRHGPLWCHMMADGNDLDALHAMADEIGLQRSWFQEHATLPHYDLTPIMRARALQHGAVEVSGREQVKRACPTLFAGLPRSERTEQRR